MGVVAGNNSARKDNGAFAEYCVAHAELCMRVPDGMSNEDAASPPAGIGTAGLGLFQKLEFPWPGEGTATDENVLVYGGSSATGALAIQLGNL